MPATKSTTKSARRPQPQQKSQASLKREAERDHYKNQLAANEERLKTRLNARGEPLTAEQMETLGRVIEMQRQKLAELEEALTAKTRPRRKATKKSSH